MRGARSPVESRADLGTLSIPCLSRDCPHRLLAASSHGNARMPAELAQNPARLRLGACHVTGTAVFLDPLLPAEEGQLADDQRPGEAGADRAAQLRDIVEVLSVETDDERRHEQDGGDHGQPLPDLVLVVRDPRLMVVAHAGDQIAAELQTVRRASSCSTAREWMLASR